MPKKIAVLGAGKMGTALARAWAKLGYAVAVGTSDIARASRHIRFVHGHLTTPEKAVQDADVVVLATSWSRTGPVLERIADLIVNKTVIDCTNPEPEEGHGLLIGHSVSGAEVNQSRAPGAFWIKALNHVYAEVIDSDGKVQGVPVTCFYCGDHSPALQQVQSLLMDLGVEPVYAGTLCNARYLEPLAALIVELVRVQGNDPGRTAYRLLFQGAHETRTMT